MKDKTLVLNKDSTFIKSNSRIILHGTWQLLGDNVVLTSDTARTIRLDTSLSIPRINLMNEPTATYVISGNSLRRYRSGNFCHNAKPDGSIKMKKHFSLEILKKIK